MLNGPCSLGIYATPMARARDEKVPITPMAAGAQTAAVIMTTWKDCFRVRMIVAVVIGSSLPWIAAYSQGNSATCVDFHSMWGTPRGHLPTTHVGILTRDDSRSMPELVHQHGFDVNNALKQRVDKGGGAIRGEPGSQGHSLINSGGVCYIIVVEDFPGTHGQ